MSNYNELLWAARNILKEHEIADANVDAWYLLAHVFGINRTYLFLHGEEPVAEEDAQRYRKLVDDRASHIPLQHLTGTQEFMGLEFEVSEDVLIPRQDTETLVEEVLKVCKNKTVLDMCTGSGCIIVSLAKLSLLKNAVGVDISEKALAIAKKNADKHQVEIKYKQSDLFNDITGQYDIIVSNPPYIPSKDIEDLMPEVKNHEPVAALDGSADGLLFYRRITAAAKGHLLPEGYIFYEIGYNQGEAVKQILIQEGFTDVSIIRDLSGLDRVAFGKKS